MKKRRNRRDGREDKTQAALALRGQWLLARVTVGVLVLTALQPALRLSTEGIQMAYSLFAAIAR
jgi:hypothetical protein